MNRDDERDWELESLRKVKTDLETLIDTSPVGMAVFDGRTGALVSFNREMGRIVDGLRNAEQPAEEILEALTVRRADGSNLSLEELPMAEALGAGETVRGEEITLQVPDGRSVRALLNATPIYSEEGELESFVTILQDLTPLEELERLRVEFLGMVSHELRIPLTSVRGSIATLLDPPAPLNPAETRQYHRVIEAQTQRMHVLMSDLLDVARVESGTLSVSPQPSDVAALADEARDAFHSGGGRHEVEIELAEDLPWVMADRMRMEQVLGNLLSNAAGNSPESSPIRVSAALEGGHVAVSVSDQGQGIPEESLPHLFRTFSRVGGQERSGGTGLGLAICRGIVQAHGGRIWAESGGPGLGARLTFTIPAVEPAGYLAPATTRETRASRRQRPVRVLAVDDEPQALRLIRDALVKSGYTPIMTTDPSDAVRLAREEHPDLVMLDLALPGTDGIELMQEIVSWVDVPVIFLSVHGQEELVARTLDMGALDYLTKPFSSVELGARIRAALRSREAPRPSQPYVLGELIIDYGQREVRVSGRPVQLTDIEYRALIELASNAGRVVTYEDLLRRVWRLDPGGDLRPIRTCISSLRRKLGEDVARSKYIITEIRVGYRMPEGEPA